jgi:hypothetical protein
MIESHLRPGALRRFGEYIIVEAGLRDLGCDQEVEDVPEPGPFAAGLPDPGEKGPTVIKDLLHLRVGEEAAEIIQGHPIFAIQIPPPALPIWKGHEQVAFVRGMISEEGHGTFQGADALGPYILGGEIPVTDGLINGVMVGFIGHARR